MVCATIWHTYLHYIYIHIPHQLELFSIQCSVYGASESKPFPYLNTVYYKFLLYVSVEIVPFSCDKFSTQTNFLYLAL